VIAHIGFQDRHHRPLGHPSLISLSIIEINLNVNLMLLKLG